ncbi:MAG: hypothetical protein R2733_17360 [Acidimicrobiales bacterium]
MSIKLFRDLNDEWARIVRSRKAAVSLETWKSEEPALHEFGDLNAVVGRAHDPDRSLRDEVLAALIRCGATDSLAWRVVLHIQMPGMVCTTNRFLPGPHSDEEVAATVVAAAWGRIAEYPLDRRPNNIGGNIGLDTRQAASAMLFRHAGKEIPDPMVFHPVAAAPSADPASRLVDVLGEAVKRGVVSSEDARLVALTRVQDVRFDELAVERGVLPHSLRRRRLRAEAMIIADVA